MKNLIVNRTNIIKLIIFLNLIISSIFILILIKQIDSVKRKEEKTLFNTLEHHKEYVKVKMKNLDKSLKFISYLYTVNDFLKYSKNKEVKDRFFNKVKEIHDAYNEVNSISLIDRNGNLIFFENGCSVDTNLLMNSTLNKEIKFSKIKIFGKKPFFDAYIPVFDKKNGDFIGTIILQIDFYKFYSFEKGHFFPFKDVNTYFVIVENDSFKFLQITYQKPEVECYGIEDFSNLFENLDSTKSFEFHLKKYNKKFFSTIEKIDENYYILSYLDCRKLQSNIFQVVTFTVLYFIFTIFLINITILSLYLLVKNFLYKKEFETKREVEKTKKYLETLLNSSPLYILDVTKDLKINFLMNDSAKVFFSADKNNFDFKNILFKDDYIKLKDSVEKFFEDKEKSFDTIELKIKIDFEERYLTFLLSPIKDENSEIVSVLVIIVDITDLKNYQNDLEDKNKKLLFTLQQLESTNEELQTSEEELVATEEELKFQIEELEKKSKILHETEERFRIALKNSNISVFLQDKELKYTYGFNIPDNIPFEMVSDRTDDEIFKGKSVEKFERMKNLSLLNGEKFSGEIELIFFKTKHDFFYTIEPFHSKEGKVIGVLTALQDITEKVEMQKELMQVFKLEALGNLAGGIAHDFNNILAGIIGNAEILDIKLGEDKEFSKYVKSIIKISESASKLTKQLLSFARKGKYQNIDFSVHKIINDVCEILERTIDRRIRIEQHLKAKPSSIKGDPSQIETVLMNLMINSKDAIMEKGGEGKIEIRTETVIVDENFNRFLNTKLENGSYIHISISDDGIGMDEEIKKHIFEPFFTTKEVGRGTGLGLASVYGIIKNHKGFIDFYSERFKGTTFNIYLPLSSDEVEEEIEKEDREIVNIPLDKTILIIDDEESIRNSCKEILEKDGMKVLTAKDGIEGIEILEKYKDDVSLVILDMIMPKMSGKDTFIEIKKIDRNIPVILCSGYSEEGEAEEIINMGVDGFLQKPYRMKTLLETIKKILK
ncbi:MAG: response regulator [bacterium]|nr:response regulator [bacterium]